ncbi:MAG: tRNA-specific 2-thiouridylase MnmA 2 [candidate division WS6 bacterium GW2011_GWF1_35_23]|uniref:tRNA-specific 2-thiouridylase MnmA 2 n=1 Tax=candidate division WS6 bacterium GW2011_GWF1_35_23 TaxID=1619097 RepID=A0A0G0C7R1_9BACT|nr:MAG: tRNA-specific 2-thiouridylase MnmA 2 [candidate division WS6 bacterium GW2011_GWF1_35_23]
MITKRRMERNKKKVLLGMSGGVDSSVSAHILQEQGYEVVGLTLNMLQCKEDTYKDVKDVCRKLGIEHISMELKDEFDKNIVKYFVTEYLNGRTPNPCVLCNKEFKFEKMLEKANELGIEYVATGHYVRCKRYKQRPKLCTLQTFPRAIIPMYFPPWRLHEGRYPGNSEEVRVREC